MNLIKTIHINTRKYCENYCYSQNKLYDILTS